jgi:lipoprotein-anchoring transpeptidase ErfK/SrfK
MNRTATFGIVAAATAILIFVIAIFIIDSSGKDEIADGVRIGTVDVGAMDREEARSLVQRKLARSVDKPITATFGKQRFVLHPDGVQARLDAAASVDAAVDRSRAGDPFSRVLGGNDAGGTVTPRVAYSRRALRAFVARIAGRVDRQARDADIEWRDGKLDRTRARNGVEVLRPRLVSKLVGVMASPSGRSVDVPVKLTERPDRTFADLAKRYPTVIAVDRDSTTLRLYKHLKLDKRYKIAVGKAGTDTAAGRYKIVEKTVDPAWHAPNKAWAGDLAGKTIPANDPRNPLEARWMGFYDGQGIHGTSDIASLGSAASHGCIRMSVPAVKELYSEVKIGTPLFLQ